jgi:hypothetical protein
VNILVILQIAGSRTDLGKRKFSLVLLAAVFRSAIAPYRMILKRSAITNRKTPAKNAIENGLSQNPDKILINIYL